MIGRKYQKIIDSPISLSASSQYGTDKDVPLDVFQAWQEGVITPIGSQVEFSGLPLIRVLTLAFITIVVGLIILSRLFYLQIVYGNEYFARSERNRMYVRSVEPPRGVIYDRNGVVLARNAPSYALTVIYETIPKEQLNELWQAVSDLFRFSNEDLGKMQTKAEQFPNQPVIIARGISHSDQLAFNLNKADFPGFQIVQDTIREYPEGEDLSSVLGYLGTLTEEDLMVLDKVRYSADMVVGKVGIEKQYESELAGTLGKVLVEAEAIGQVISESPILEGKAGTHITLTIDAKLQHKLKQVLAEGIEKYDAVGGSAIVMNPKNGEVLGMVSLPTYDNNLFQREPIKAAEILTDTRGLLINRAISGLYAAGSTVKMAIGAEALKRGTITAATIVSTDPQVIEVGGFRFPDWTYSFGRGPYAPMNLEGALAVSSDTFFYKVGGGYPPDCGGATNPCSVKPLGVEGLVSALKAFGFGTPTNIDLPGESAGLVPDPAWKMRVRGEDWYLGNTYHLSIGQGDLLVTPLQVLHQVNQIATDAKTVLPHLRVLPEGEEPAIEKPVDLEDLHVVRSGMVAAVKTGIIFPLRAAGLPAVAAKTGTAEFGTLNKKGEYQTHAWVTGFAPVENPQISFVLLLESGGGSSNAAEVARIFLDWYFNEYAKAR